jgi:hypothetical protein
VTPCLDLLRTVSVQTSIDNPWVKCRNFLCILKTTLINPTEEQRILGLLFIEYTLEVTTVFSQVKKLLGSGSLKLSLRMSQPVWCFVTTLLRLPKHGPNLMSTKLSKIIFCVFHLRSMKLFSHYNVEKVFKIGHKYTHTRARVNGRPRACQGSGR